MLYGRRGGASILFEEDFDLPPRSGEPELEPEPEVIEPVFTVAEMEAARAAAWREADERARAEVAAATETVARTALAAVGTQLAQAVAEARAFAESSAEAITHLLLSALGAAFPALCARHGDAEVQAVLSKMLPALYNEPKVTIRVAPSAVSAVMDELGHLDPDLAEQMQVVPHEGLQPGDVRVAWRAGQAARDTVQLWQDIEAILAPAGLLPSDPSLPQAPLTRVTPKETVDVD